MYFFLSSYLRCNYLKLVIFKLKITNFKYKFLIQDSEVCFLNLFNFAEHFLSEVKIKSIKNRTATSFISRFYWYNSLNYIFLNFLFVKFKNFLKNRTGFS